MEIALSSAVAACIRGEFEERGIREMNKLLVIVMLTMAAFTQFAEACSHGCSPMNHGGGYAVGRFGAVRPAYYGPYGRYPKLAFHAPIRRSLGLPGFTPVRQFAFGRGAIRRQTRRAYLFGPRYY